MTLTLWALIVMTCTRADCDGQVHGVYMTREACIAAADKARAKRVYAVCVRGVWKFDGTRGYPVK